MNLIVEIGNTALKAAWTENSILGKTFRYQGEHPVDFVCGIACKEKPDWLVVSSVYELTVSDKERLDTICRHLEIIGLSNVSFYKKYDLPQYLSPDRAASIIAVRRLFCGKSCTLFDFGNTLTADFIDGNGKYEGGNISLGCNTRFKALNRYSRNLPLLGILGEADEIGKSLQSSIQSGIISGIMFEIQGYLEKKPENIVVFTGGDANYFVKKMKNSIFVVCNLVMIGLAIITDEYVRKENN